MNEDKIYIITGTREPAWPGEDPPIYNVCWRATADEAHKMVEALCKQVDEFKDRCSKMRLLNGRDDWAELKDSARANYMDPYIDENSLYSYEGLSEDPRGLYE